MLQLFVHIFSKIDAYLIGMTSPFTGAPSINSNLVRVSVSLNVFGPWPEVSLRTMSSSMCLILMRTNRKKILPRITSYDEERYRYLLK